MNDCAWCGTGNGICDDCTNKMFAQSAQIAETGDHLVTIVFSEEQTDTNLQAGKGGTT